MAPHFVLWLVRRRIAHKGCGSAAGSQFLPYLSFRHSVMPSPFVGLYHMVHTVMDIFPHMGDAHAISLFTTVSYVFCGLLGIRHLIQETGRTGLPGGCHVDSAQADSVV